jgi:uncharacterized protein (DUF2267 family)
MDYEEFMRVVQVYADLAWEEAERAVRTVLEILGERIASGEARDLAEQLPPELSAYLLNDGDAQGLDRDDFVRRVAEREGVDPATAARHVRAVFTAIWRARSCPTSRPGCPRTTPRYCRSGRTPRFAALASRRSFCRVQPLL